jgi:hypothetical protein
MASRQRARRHDDSTLNTFELPAFKAGMVKAALAQIHALAQTEQPQAFHLIARLCEVAWSDAEEWQRYAADITAYPYRRAP